MAIIQSSERCPVLTWVQLILLTLLSLLFWYLRISYWNEITEAPFSDMADYWEISKRFLCCAMLNHTEFWQTYLKPALPVVGAAVFSFTGPENLVAWRIFLALLLFISLLWLGRELFISTKSFWLMFGLLAAVTLAKSSIFWSYKFATEGLGEALLYLVCAGTMNIYRRGVAWRAAVGLGLATIVALYNRPNIILIVPLIALAISIKGLSWSSIKTLRSYLPNLTGLALGALLVVVPFALRSYQLYGAPLFSPTQGPYSFLWEFGAVSIVDPVSGEKITRTAQELQAEAPQKFQNDFQAAQYAKVFVRSWMAENWNDLYPRLIRNRFFSTIEKRDIALSRVPRTTLFQGWQEHILIDKSWFFFAVGSIGLLIMAFVYGGGLYIVAGSALLPWLFGIFFSSDPRLLEPSLPLVLFGNIALVVVGVRSVLRKRLRVS